MAINQAQMDQDLGSLIALNNAQAALVQTLIAAYNTAKQAPPATDFSNEDSEIQQGIGVVTQEATNVTNALGLPATASSTGVVTPNPAPTQSTGA